jgi:hypothetical protein
MGARDKLNSFWVVVIVLVAAFIGAVNGSWLVFFVALAVLVAIAVGEGGIRPGRR